MIDWTKIDPPNSPTPTTPDTTAPIPAVTSTAPTVTQPVQTPTLGPSQSAPYETGVWKPATQEQVDAMDPSERMARGIDYLGYTLFGKGNGSPLGGIPVLPEALGMAGNVSHDLATTTLVRPFEAGAGALARIPMAWLPGGADEKFNRIGEWSKTNDPKVYQEWQLVNAAANSDVLYGGNLKADFNMEVAKYIDDQQYDSSLGTTPELAMHGEGVGSLGGMISHAIQGFLGVGSNFMQDVVEPTGLFDPYYNPGTKVSHLLDAAANPTKYVVSAGGNTNLNLDTMNDFERYAVQNVQSGKWTEQQAQDWIDQNINAKLGRIQEAAVRLENGMEVSDVEQRAVEMWKTGGWSLEHAQDWMVSHGQGVTRHPVGQMVGTVLLDPLMYATLGAGAVSSLGAEGVRVAGVAGVNVVGTARWAGPAARFAASAENVGNLTRVAASADTLFEKAAVSVAAVQKSQLGTAFRIGRGMFDPFAVYKPSTVARATTDLLSANALKAFERTHGTPAVQEVRAIARESGLGTEVDSAIYSYTMDQARLMVGRTYVRRMLDEGLGEELVQQDIEEVVSALVRNAGRDAETQLVDHMYSVSRSSFPPEEEANLAGRMSVIFGKDVPYWEKKLATTSHDAKAVLHEVTYKRTEVEYEQARAMVNASEYHGELPLDNMVLMTTNTLDDVVAADIIGNITSILKNADEPQRIAAATAEWNAQAMRYPKMANIGYATGGQEQVEKLVKELQKHLDAGLITKRAGDAELADPLLKPVRDVLDRHSVPTDVTLTPAELLARDKQAEMDALFAVHQLGFREVSAAEFHPAIKRASKVVKSNGRTVGETVYVYSKGEYAKMRLFLREDGKTGFAIKPDGDLVSVFNVGEKRIIERIVKYFDPLGGTKGYALDEGRLIELFGLGGQREVRRVPWDPQYAPPGWKGGTPDVVYMETPRHATRAPQPGVPFHDLPAEEQQRAAKLLADRGYLFHGSALDPRKGGKVLAGEGFFTTESFDYANMYGRGTVKNSAADAAKGTVYVAKRPDVVADLGDPAFQSKLRDGVAADLAVQMAAHDTGTAAIERSAKRVANATTPREMSSALSEYAIDRAKLLTPKKGIDNSYVGDLLRSSTDAPAVRFPAENMGSVGGKDGELAGTIVFLKKPELKSIDDVIGYDPEAIAKRAKYEADMKAYDAAQAAQAAVVPDPREVAVPSGKFEDVADALGAPRVEPTGTPEFVFRAISDEDWQGIQKRGYMQSDGRMNLDASLPAAQKEGTVASSTDTGTFYMPGGLRSNPDGTYIGRVVKIKVAGGAKWTKAKDGYWKTPDKVPNADIVAVSPPITRTVKTGPRERTWAQFQKDMGITPGSPEDASFRASYAKDIEVRDGVEWIIQGKDNPIRMDDFTVGSPALDPKAQERYIAAKAKFDADQLAYNQGEAADAAAQAKYDADLKAWNAANADEVEKIKLHAEARANYEAQTQGWATKQAQHDAELAAARAKGGLIYDNPEAHAKALAKHTADKADYEAGWNASKRSSKADLDAAEARYEAKSPNSGNMFAAGWTDEAAGNAKYGALGKEPQLVAPAVDKPQAPMPLHKDVPERGDPFEIGGVKYHIIGEDPATGDWLLASGIDVNSGTAKKFNSVPKAKDIKWENHRWQMGKPTKAPEPPTPPVFSTRTAPVEPVAPAGAAAPPMQKPIAPRAGALPDPAFYPEVNGRRRLWNIGFRPDEEVAWGLRRDVNTGRWVIDRDPTISHTVDAVPGHQPFSDTTRNVLGMIVGKSKAERLNGPVDSLEAFLNTQRDVVTGRRMVMNIEKRYERIAMEAGIPGPIAKEIFASAREVAQLDRTTVRGLNPGNVWDAVHKIIPRDLVLKDGSTMNIHIIMDHLLKAAEGDLRIIGVTSNLSQRMRNQLRKMGDGSNFAGQLTVTMYNRLRYSFNPMFVMQRITDAPYYKILYGVTPVGKEAGAELRTITDNLARSGLARDFSMDMPEYATRSNFTAGIKSAMQQAGLKDNRLQAILEAPDVLIANNMTDMLHARLGDMVRGALDNLASAAEKDPALKAEMLKAGDVLTNSFEDWRRVYSNAAGRRLNDNEVGLRYIQDQLNAWRRHAVRADGTIDMKQLIHEGERFLPNDIGEIASIRPDDLAIQLGYPDSATLRRDITGHIEKVNGEFILVKGEHDVPWLVEQLRTQFSAHPDYVRRVEAYYSETWDDFWHRLSMGTDAGGLDISTHYAKEAQTVIAREALSRGMDPWEYLSGVMASNIGAKSLDTHMGQLIGFLKTGKSQQPLEEWTKLFRAHLDVSAQETLMREFEAATGKVSPAVMPAEFSFVTPPSAPGRAARPPVAKVPDVFTHEAGYVYRVETPAAMESGLPTNLGVTTGTPTAFYEGKDATKRAIFRMKDDGTLATGRHGAGGADRMTTHATPPEQIEMLGADGKWHPLAADPYDNFFANSFPQMVKDRILSGKAHPNPEVEGYMQALSKWVMETLGPKLAKNTRSDLRRLVEAVPTSQAVNYNRSHGLVVSLLKNKIEDAQQDIFRLAEMQTQRTVLERSLNHPLFGLYPASYMWGKVLPETVKFLAKNPYAATYAIADVQRAIAIQREYDPDYEKIMAGVDASSSAFLADYLTPGLPWSDHQARMSPMWRDIIGGKDIGSIWKDELATISPQRWVAQVINSMNEVPDAIDAMSPKTPAAVSPLANLASGAGPSAQDETPGDAGQQITGPTKASALAPILQDDLSRLSSILLQGQSAEQ